MVPPRTPEPDLAALLAGASAFGPKARCIPADAGECHGNVATLWIDGAIASIGTGYALSDDDLWRQHSWGVDAEDALVESAGVKSLDRATCAPVTCRRPWHDMRR